MINSKPSLLDRMVLNNVQNEAVKYIEGPELVFAGAGTGKTRVLTAKIAYLIYKGYSPDKIFAATFTNKAAREMRSRVESFLGVPASGLWIGTFHSLCVRILRREACALNYSADFTIYDSKDQLSLVKKILKQYDVDDRTMPPKYLLSIISSYKSSCVTPGEVEQKAMGFRDREIAKLYNAYQKALVQQQAMDFDDLITNTVYMLRENQSILKKYQNLFSYILVDEYQDTNTAQFRLVHLLSKEHKQLFAVGDDDQSIYGWRGAKIDNILSFETHFPQTRIFKLEQNYRSTKEILNFSNAVIAPNVNRAHKKLWTDRKGGDQVVVNRFRDDRQEALAVAEKSKQLLQSMKGSDIAVLFRTNAQSRVFEEAFRKKNVPYVLVGGTGFYERAEIKDCLAYLRLLVNPKDDVGFERIVNVPPRGLGEKARSDLAQTAAQNRLSLLQTVMGGHTDSLGSRCQKGFGQIKEIFTLLGKMVSEGEDPHQILKSILQLSGYMDMLTQQDTEEAQARVENINELLNALASWVQENPGRSLSGFLEEVSLVSDVDNWQARDDAVNLMTMHCAKGLEFKQVFLVGIEDGIIPSRQNVDDDSKIEEERRLFYVGATRAMGRLECSYVDQRRRFGEILPSEPTRFLFDVQKNLYFFKDLTAVFGEISNCRPKIHGQSGFKSPKTGAGYKKQQSDFSALDHFSQETVQFRMGQSVKHKTYGRGRVLGISGAGDDLKLTVLFNDGARRRLMAKFANLET